MAEKPSPPPERTLTREKYENEIKDIGKFDYAFGSCRPANERLSRILAHDAALRERVAYLEREVAEGDRISQENAKAADAAEAERDRLAAENKKLREAFRVTATEEREWVRMVNRWTQDKKNFYRDVVASATEQMDTYLTGVLNELRGGGDGSIAAGEKEVPRGNK